MTSTASLDPVPTRPLRRFVPERLTAEQRALYEEISGGPRAVGPQHFRLTGDDGALEGPFNAFLLRPNLGARLQALGAAIRYSTDLTDRQREIAILVVASHWQSEFEQHAHEAIGRAVGLTDHELSAIRAGSDADTPERWPDTDDLTFVRCVRSLVEQGDLDDDAYRAGVDLVGEQGVLELTTLVGYYATLALQLRVFRVTVPAESKASTP